jgi:PAS domain S-box-containing protein
LVRIVVAQPRARPGGTDLGTVAALERLGREVLIHVVDDAEGCLALVQEGDGVDLLVLDLDLGPDAWKLLSALRTSGPPVVVVTADPRQEVALDAFRRGAADCVGAGRDYHELLPVVALEQIRRWRTLRAQGAQESRIRWLERLHETIVAEIPAALAVLAEEDRVVTVNPEFSRQFGVGLEQAAGRPLRDLLPGDLFESGGIAEVLADAAGGRSVPPRIARLEAPDSELRAFDVRAERLDEEGRVLLVLSEVSDRERLAKRIGDLKRYNENIIQNLNSALLVVGLEGQITFANAVAEQILGVASGVLQGQSLWEWFPEGRGPEALLARTLEQGVRFRSAEAVIRRPGGEHVPIGLSIAPMLDGDGTRIGAVAIFQDLSEIKQLQRQVLQTEKMASIGQLAAGVAHEINNPMGFIHANLCQMAEYVADLRRLWDAVEALRTSVAKGDSEEVRRCDARLGALADEVDSAYLLSDLANALRESQEGSERIRHIVQDLRAFSHHDTAERVPADINECLDSTASIVWAMMKHSVILETDYGELPPVPCYPMQLKQVFMNLLVNAYQAIEARQLPPGQRGAIRLETRPGPAGVVVSVSDTGVGIPPGHLERIFDPFFTTKEVGEGTGLGLATSFNIVRRHGGTIRVDSDAERGTTFEVFLPLEHGEDDG